jgi:hypothetical protein
MWGVENYDAKHGNHMAPRRLRYTLHNPEGRKPTLAKRFTRRMMRGRKEAAA